MRPCEQAYLSRAYTKHPTDPKTNTFTEELPGSLFDSQLTMGNRKAQIRKGFKEAETLPRREDWQTPII